MDLMKSIRYNSLSLVYIIDSIGFERFDEVFDFYTDWIFQKIEICVQNLKIFETKKIARAWASTRQNSASEVITLEPICSKNHF